MLPSDSILRRSLKRLRSKALTYTLGLALALSWALVPLSHAQETKMVSVFSYNGARQENTVEVPQKPERVVVIDYAVFDIMAKLGLSSKIVGSAKGVAPQYLQSIIANPEIANVGTVKAVDYEALMALEPEVIFIGGRLAAQYDKLSAIAPVVFLAVDYEQPLIESVKRSTDVIATIFGQEQAAGEVLAGYEQRIAALKEKAQGQSVLIGMVNASQFKTMGNHGRCAFIGQDIGLNNLAADLSSNHGNESSFELLVKLNPDYLFVLDRDSAIGTNGAKLARDVMDNELVHKTKAYQEGKLFYLNSAVWYLSEGGLSALDYMIQDLEAAF